LPERRAQAASERASLMVTCPKGHQNPDDNEFCSECGAALPKQAPASPATPAAEATDQPPAASPPASTPAAARQGVTFSRTQLIAAALVGAVLLIGILGLLVTRGSGSSSAKQAAVVTRVVTVLVPQPTQAAPTQSAPTVVTAVTQAPTASPSPTPSPSPSPSPSSTPAKTTTPVAPPNTDTPAGTVLAVGQTWKQGGLELTLTESALHIGNPDFQGIYLLFTLVNKRGNDFVLTYTQDTFTATDNFQQPLPVVEAQKVFQSSGFNSINKKFGDSGVQDKQTTTLPFDGGERIVVQADITQTTLSSIDITVANLSTITSATWQIPINH
jgi:hypothetical protein